MDGKHIVLIGSGGVATHFALALHRAGHRIQQVFSRDLSHARDLGIRVDAEAINELEDVTPDADLYLISVSDKAIESVVQRLPTGLKCVIHTSGSTDIQVLAGRFRSWGVVYPVQTFSKARAVNLKTVPLLIEGDTEETLGTLSDCMRTVSNQVSEANSRQRCTLHIAAVFACNFTNHLYALSDGLLKDNKLSFELLKPLILETAEKAVTHPPAQIQTGPAVRQDNLILQRHLELLSDRPELMRLYGLLSESIQYNSASNLDDPR